MPCLVKCRIIWPICVDGSHLCGECFGNIWQTLMWSTFRILTILTKGIDLPCILQCIDCFPKLFDSRYDLKGSALEPEEPPT